MAEGVLIAQSMAVALEAMAAGTRPIAGGTDLVVAARQGKAPLPRSLVAINSLHELTGLERSSGGVRVGAVVSHEEIASSALIRREMTALADACSIVGSHATRAHGTIGGNLMNASPAMDTGGALLCLGATVRLDSVHGSRSIAIETLLTGPGVTSAAPAELLVAVHIPDQPPHTGSAYVRLEYRRQMEIAVVGTTAMVTLQGNRLTRARIAVTAVTPTVALVPEAGEALVGTPGDAEAVDRAARATVAAARPITDVRASCDYRKAMTAVIARRAIETAIRRARGEIVEIPATDAVFGSRRGET